MASDFASPMHDSAGRASRMSAEAGNAALPRRVPAHSHPTTEHVTVLSGDFHAGMGDRLDTSKGQAFQPGGFVAMPANMHHFAWTTLCGDGAEGARADQRAHQGGARGGQ